VAQLQAHQDICVVSKLLENIKTPHKLDIFLDIL